MKAQMQKRKTVTESEQREERRYQVTSELVAEEEVLDEEGERDKGDEWCEVY